MKIFHISGSARGLTYGRFGEQAFVRGWRFGCVACAVHDPS